MSTEAQIDAALEAVLTAARNHRAVLRAGASEERVWRAYIALNNATVRYDDLISEVYDAAAEARAATTAFFKGVFGL